MLSQAYTCKKGSMAFGMALFSGIMAGFVAVHSRADLLTGIYRYRAGIRVCLNGLRTASS
ncbi:hypothetical protein K3G39_06610 [Pontibacter sp. HSC-14F20]|uniref:hypothetical protein n=1 Tax=Pontibacter sp. HSC-14F20 TaxID=2864136 RepID=UPI001C73D045|nr:hypothetical protein [Pontibacter sp. HSC-14F20]MBX0332904.1 hypothetical protein [Pontibacter sp. HSC-14F20]